MSNMISNYSENRGFTIRLSKETYDALMLYINGISSGPQRTSRVAAVEYLVSKALKAEKGEPYVPLTAPGAV